MINGIIISQNNPVQLNLLLSSIDVNSNDIFDLSVVYTSTNYSYNLGYEKLIKKYPKINWVEGVEDFKEKILDLLEKSKSDYTCFFTDDNILFSKVKEEDLVTQLRDDKDTFCFSMRLGKNTIKCHTMDADNIIRPNYEDDNYITWDWQVHYLDFGYPLSLNGHIFRTKEIKKLTKKVSFSSLEDYESGLQIFDNFPRKNMSSFKDSVLVSGLAKETESIEKLNASFILEDLEVDYKNMDFNQIEGCYQELDFPLNKFELI